MRCETSWCVWEKRWVLEMKLECRAKRELITETTHTLSPYSYPDFCPIASCTSGLRQVLLYHWHTSFLLFCHLVMSDSLWPHRLRHSRLSVLHCLPEFAQTPVHWDDDVIQPSHPLSPFSSCPQSFPAFSLFASGGQRIGASTSLISL